MFNGLVELPTGDRLHGAALSEKCPADSRQAVSSAQAAYKWPYRQTGSDFCCKMYKPATSCECFKLYKRYIIITLSPTSVLLGYDNV